MTPTQPPHYQEENGGGARHLHRAALGAVQVRADGAWAVIIRRYFLIEG